MSASFIKIYEIPSDVPIVSSAPPPKTKKKPLALTLGVTQSKILIYTGVPSRVVKSIAKTSEGKYDFEQLKLFLIGLKKRHMHEKTVVLEPRVDLEYQEIIEIMDAVRVLRRTDEALYLTKVDKQGNKFEERLKTLFGNIIFGNIQSAVRKK
jgi:biopolymer transport protein ExbD